MLSLMLRYFDITRDRARYSAMICAHRFHVIYAAAAAYAVTLTLFS